MAANLHCFTFPTGCSARVGLNRNNLFTVLRFSHFLISKIVVRQLKMSRYANCILHRGGRMSSKHVVNRNL